MSMVRTGSVFLGISLIALASVEAQKPSKERQIEWAVAAAPEGMRADATVLGHAGGGKMVTLRKGTGTLVCLADNPEQPNHHVACYHKDLDPFMARGRELKAQGMKDPAVDSVRMAEIKAGKLKIPTVPAALYQLMADPGNADAATGAIKSPRTLYVVYIPYATPESTGLSLVPGKGPWLMDPGLPWAHVMISGS